MTTTARRVRRGSVTCCGEWLVGSSAIGDFSMGAESAAAPRAGGERNGEEQRHITGSQGSRQGGV